MKTTQNENGEDVSGKYTSNIDHLFAQQKKSSPAALVPRSSSERFKSEFDALGININRSGNGQVKTILFTSSSDGEGVSTIVKYFVKTLGRNKDARILVVDTNLRKPKLHKSFRVKRIPGLVDTLSRKKVRMVNAEIVALFKDLKKISGNDTCWVLPAGRGHSRPSKLLGADSFREFLVAARQIFDYIILDGPPINDAPEYKILASVVDGVILVVESGKTRRQAAIRAKLNLARADAHLIGVVLNKRRYYIPDCLYRLI